MKGEYNKDMDSLKKSRTKVKLKMKILNRKPHQQIK